MTSEQGSTDERLAPPRATVALRLGSEPLSLWEPLPEATTATEAVVGRSVGAGRSVRCQHCPMVCLSSDQLARHMSDSHIERLQPTPSSSSAPRESAKSEEAAGADPTPGGRPKRRASEKRAPAEAPPKSKRACAVGAAAEERLEAAESADAGVSVASSQAPAFRCPECPKVYQSARSLKRHSAIHSRLVPCLWCAQVLRSEDERIKHVEECHQNGGAKEQMLEDSELKIEDSMDYFLADQSDAAAIGKYEPGSSESHPANPFSASADSVVVAAAVKSAPEAGPGEPKLKASPAGRRRAPKKGGPAEQPAAAVAPMDTVVCSACLETFDEEEAFVEHQRQKHGGACPAGCDLCELQFPTAPLLRAHKIANHRGRGRRRGGAVGAPDEEKDPFSRWYVWADAQKHLKCDLCSYNSLWYHKGRFLEHYRIHTGERPYTCELCGKQFRTRTLMHKHVTFVHEGVKEHACDLCGRRFSDKRYMEDHRRIHTGERPYVCDLCGKTFKQSASLFIHKELHKGLRKHACDMCGKRFTTRSSLNIHIKRHVGERNFVCAVCGKAFVDGKHLRDHSTVHSDERPFGCELCGARFKLMKHLKQHGRTHKRDLPG